MTEKTKLFFTASRASLETVSAAAAATSFIWTSLTQRETEENQLETNMSCQQTITELAKVCQIKPEEEMSREWRQQCGDIDTGLILTDVSSVPTKHTGKGKRSVPHLTCCGCIHIRTRTTLTPICFSV